MICPKCKSQIDDPTAKFCDVCGEPLDQDPLEEQPKPEKKHGFFSLEERENPLPWWRYLIAIGAYFFIMEIGAFIFQVIFTLVYQSFSGEPARIDGTYTEAAANFVNIWMQIATYLAVTITTVILLLKPLKLDIQYSNSKKLKTFAFVGMGIGGVFAANALCTTFYTILELFFGKGYFSGDSQNQQAIVDMLKHAGVITFALYAIVLVVLAPAVEELIYRKALCTLLGKMKRIWRIVISAAIFGAIHVVTAMLGYVFSGAWELLFIEFMLGFQYVAMGAVLAAAYEYSNRNVIVSFAVHAFNNLLSVITIIILLM